MLSSEGMIWEHYVGKIGGTLCWSFGGEAGNSNGCSEEVRQGFGRYGIPTYFKVQTIKHVETTVGESQRTPRVKRMWWDL